MVTYAHSSGDLFGYLLAFMQNVKYLWDISCVFWKAQYLIYNIFSKLHPAGQKLELITFLQWKAFSRKNFKQEYNERYELPLY